MKRLRASRFCVAALWRLPPPRLRAADPSVRPFTPPRAKDLSVRALPPPRSRAKDPSLRALPLRPPLACVCAGAAPRSAAGPHRGYLHARHLEGG
jgi:hypothetical protein